jgi:predicted  nucleic acid-binding Zn-ribbon protein
MTDDEKLAALKEQAYAIEAEVRDNDHQIERLMFALAGGDGGSAIGALQDYNTRQNGLMFDLGKLEAQIEDYENRIRENADRDREQQLAQEFTEGQPPAQEDHLDWLRPALEARETPEDLQVLERWENHLDWLDPGDGQTAPAPEERWLDQERDER